MLIGRHYWVYVLASRNGGTMYVGVTNDPMRRAFQRRLGARCLQARLVFDDPTSAIKREKKLKPWCRARKLRSKRVTPIGMTSISASPVSDAGLRSAASGGVYWIPDRRPGRTHVPTSAPRPAAFRDDVSAYDCPV